MNKLPIKTDCGFLRDSNGEVIFVTKEQAQRLADKKAKAENARLRKSIWTGVVYDGQQVFKDFDGAIGGNYFRLNLAGQKCKL